MNLGLDVANASALLVHLLDNAIVDLIDIVKLSQWRLLSLGQAGGRLIVVVSFAEPIWASGHDAALKAEHMTAVAPPMKSSSKTLHPKGRLHEDIDGVTGAMPKYG